MLKAVYILLGSLALCLGVMGILIPGLPTTPFLLLAAALYMRSSEKLYNKLLNHPRLGKYIVRYRDNKGMTRNQKIYALVLMWLMIALSCIFLINVLWLRILVLSLGLLGSIVMGVIVPTAK